MSQEDSANWAPSWLPHGLAIQDYFSGEEETFINVHTIDKDITPFPAQLYFREYEDFSNMDELAISLCQGKILDIGAGAGCISLFLQEMGEEVVGLDIAPHAVGVMKARGVERALAGDVLEFAGERFDTLLMLMNGIGFTGNLAGLDRFLAHAHTLLEPGGQILLDSSDMRKADVEGDLTGPKSGYFGEIWYQMEYKGTWGAPYYWLYLDPDTLAEHANQSGWECDILFEGLEGYYLARLSRKDEHL